MKALFNVMLRGAVVGTVATMLAVGCGDNKDDNDNPGGEAGQGGSSGSGGTKNTTAGTKSEAGEGGGTASPGGAGNEGGSVAGGDTGGAGPGTGGAAEGGSGGAGSDPFGEGGAGVGGAGYTGPAIAKFCNTLYFGNDPTTFRLEIGEGNDMVSFTAMSGECAPPDGEACKEIPTGAEVSVKLFDSDADVPLDDATTAIEVDSQYVFVTDTDAEKNPIWDAFTLKPQFACEDVIYNDVL